MTKAEAIILTGECVTSSMWAVGLFDEYEPLPDRPLEDLLEANRIVSEMEPEKTAGGQKVRVHVEPRLLALLYAFENYDQSPKQMLEALGFGVR